MWADQLFMQGCRLIQTGDCFAGIKHLLGAIELNQHADALARLQPAVGSARPAKQDTERDYQLIMSQNHSPQTLMILGIQYLTGLGVNSQRLLGLRLLLEAAMQGQVLAGSLLGYYSCNAQSLRDGEGVQVLFE